MSIVEHSGMEGRESLSGVALSYRETCLLNLLTSRENPFNVATYYTIAKDFSSDSYLTVLEPNLNSLVFGLNQKFRGASVPLRVLGDSFTKGRSGGFILLDPVNSLQRECLSGLDERERSLRIKQILDERIRQEVSTDLAEAIKKKKDIWIWTQIDSERSICFYDYDNFGFPYEDVAVVKRNKGQKLELEVFLLGKRAMKDMLKIFIDNGFYIDHALFPLKSLQYLVERFNQMLESSTVLRDFRIYPVEPIGYSLTHKEECSSPEKQRVGNYERRRGVIRKWLDGQYPSLFEFPYKSGCFAEKYDIYSRYIEGGGSGEIYLSLINLAKFKSEINFDFDPRSPWLIIYDHIDFFADKRHGFYGRKIFEIGSSVVESIHILLDGNIKLVPRSKRKSIYKTLERFKKRLVELGDDPDDEDICDLMIPIPKAVLNHR